MSIFRGTTSILQVYKNSLLGASLGFRTLLQTLTRQFFLFFFFLFKFAQGTSAVEDPHAHPEVRLRHLLAGTAIYVSSYYYICVLVLLYMCPHTTICVHIRWRCPASTHVLILHTHTHTHTHTHIHTHTHNVIWYNIHTDLRLWGGAAIAVMPRVDCYN